MVNGTRTNCRLPHQKICRRTNTLPAEKYHWGNQEPSFKRDAVLLYPRGEKSGHGANQRGFPSVCSTKAASEAGRNQSAWADMHQTEEAQSWHGTVKEANFQEQQFIWNRKTEYHYSTGRRSLWLSVQPQQHDLLSIPCRPQSQHESGLSVSLLWLWSGWRCDRLHRKTVSTVPATSGWKAGCRFWTFCNR